jgi:uncharacterized membrane protein YbhN (UPF0104 family)
LSTEIIRYKAAPALDFFRRYGIAAMILTVAVFASIFVYANRAELADAGRLLSTVHPAWIVLLAMLQALIISNAALIYKLTLRRLGHSVGALRLAEIQLKRVVVGSVTPLGGPPSLYVMVRSLGAHGVSPGDALLTAATRTVATMAGMALLLVPALLLHRPTTVTIAAGSLLLVLLVGLAGLLVVLLRDSALSRRLERWLPERVTTAVAALREHRIRVSDLFVPLVFGAIWHAVMMSMLFVALAAVGYQASLKTVLVGYVAGNLMLMLAPVFRGVGLVELAMALALQRAGVPAVESVSAALLFRVGDLWLPLFGGFLVQAWRLWLPGRIAMALFGRFASVADSASRTAAERPSVGRVSVAFGRMSLVSEVLVTTGDRHCYRALSPDQRRQEFGDIVPVTPNYTGLL